jgi:hypothetical protein
MITIRPSTDSIVTVKPCSWRRSRAVAESRSVRPAGERRDLLRAAVLVAEESRDDEDQHEGRDDPRPLLLAFALGVGGSHVVLSGCESNNEGGRDAVVAELER